MAKKDQVVLKEGDIKGLSEKLQGLYRSLPPGQAQLFEYLMEAAGLGAGQWPPPPWVQPKFKYKPRGAKVLVFGGADGLTILMNSHGKITVVPPIGPLPMDRTGMAIPIPGAL